MLQDSSIAGDGGGEDDDYGVHNNNAGAERDTLDIMA